jgi:hypothetical protein
MEENKMVLTIEEKQAVQQYQQGIKDAMATLGSIRRQYARTESNLLSRLDQLESEFMDCLRTLAKSRGMPENEDWVFDPNTYGFVKKQS